MEKTLKRNLNLPTYRKAALQVIAYKRIRDVVNDVLGRFNLNTTQWIILGVLYENGSGLRITDIARTLQVEVPLITILAQPLLGNGLVKNKISKTDRRSKPLALTKRGRELVGQIETKLEDTMKPLEIGLSDYEVGTYFQTLEVFIANARPA